MSDINSKFCITMFVIFGLRISYLLCKYPYDIFVSSPNFARVSRLVGTAVAQWLRCCATNRKVAGSILAGVGGFFIDIKSFRSHYGPGFDSASNRNEYQEYFLGVKASGA